MKTRFSLLIVFVILFSESGLSQLIGEIEIRPRAEMRNGYRTLISNSQDVAFFVDQRTRLNLNYEEGPVSLGLSVQDIRVWGSTSQLNSRDGFLSLHEAWVQIDLHSDVAIKAGRQELIYDNHRIFGNVGWAQQGRSHDALLLKVKTHTSKFDLGLAFNQNNPGLTGTYYAGLNNYKTMQYVWWNERVSDEFSLSLLGLNQGLQVSTTPIMGSPTDTTKTVFNQTIGTHLKLKQDKSEFNASLYYEFGDQANWAQTELNAIEASLEASFKVGSGGSSIGFGAEYLSGTSPGETENKSFTPWFGTNHKFNGHMDYFYVGNHANNIGLVDYFAKIGLSNKSWTFSVHGHAFQTAAEVAGMDSYLGTEIDLSLKNAFWDKKANVVLGYSQMIAGESMEMLKGEANPAEAQNWVWLMLSAKLEVLNISKDN